MNNFFIPTSREQEFRCASHSTKQTIVTVMGRIREQLSNHYYELALSEISRFPWASDFLTEDEKSPLVQINQQNGWTIL